jgi:hypothetical protein
VAVNSDHVRALSAALPLALYCGACNPTPGKKDLVPIGGAWYFDLRSRFPVEAGWTPVDLYRDWKGKPVLVARNIEDKKYYEPDCVVFVTGHASPPYVVYAACGDRLPGAIDVRDYRHWTLETDGLRHEERARVVDGMPVKRTEVIPFDDIRAVALRQPPFDPRWRPGGPGTVGAVQAIEREVPVDPGHRDSNGWTPLTEVAASAGTPQERLALVDALIKHGVDVNATNAYGYSALMMAASKGDVELVQRLLEARAFVDARANDGRTALMFAAESLGQRTETVRALIEAGADRTIRDRNGQTAADKVRHSQDTQLLSLLQ